jgi:hypothetical protein
VCRTGFASAIHNRVYSTFPISAVIHTVRCESRHFQLAPELLQLQLDSMSASSTSSLTSALIGAAVGACATAAIWSALNKSSKTEKVRCLGRIFRRL